MNMFVIYGLGVALGWVAHVIIHPYLLTWQARSLQGLPADVDKDIYEEVEVIKNATVQVLQNSRTGEYSFGWWRN